MSEGLTILGEILTMFLITYIIVYGFMFLVTKLGESE